jgi:hypothetical protein
MAWFIQYRLSPGIVTCITYASDSIRQLKNWPLPRCGKIYPAINREWHFGVYLFLISVYEMHLQPNQ